MSVRTLATAGILLTLTIGACSSGSSSTPRTKAREPGDHAFEFVYDTITGPYTGAKEWISRDGAISQIPEHGYTLNNAVPSADGRRLVVAQTPDGASEARIAIIDLSGKVTRVLSQTDGCFPGGLTGTLVVITCGTSETDWQVLAVDAAGHRTALGPDNAGASAALSHDGRTVLAASGTQIYTVPVTGGARKPLTDTGQARDSGAWSEDDKHIAYLAANKNGGQSVYLISVGGTGRRKVGDVPFEGDLHLTISPDGKRILVAGSAQVESRFWTVGTDGSTPHVLPASLTGGDPHALAS